MVRNNATIKFDKDIDCKRVMLIFMLSDAPLGDF